MEADHAESLAADNVEVWDDLGVGEHLRERNAVLARLPTTQRSGDGWPGDAGWAQRLGVPASKLLLPLSYAAILGGTCTLIGTSTNLVVDVMLQSRLGINLGLFELAWVGIPLLLVGGTFLVLFASRILPDRGGVTEELDQVREYGVEVEVMAPPHASHDEVLGAVRKRARWIYASPT